MMRSRWWWIGREEERLRGALALVAAASDGDVESCARAHAALSDPETRRALAILRDLLSADAETQASAVRRSERAARLKETT